jgi:protocatechuate 3,4-dioxygenase beta subunit
MSILANRFKISRWKFGANATSVYSGVMNRMNGNPNDTTNIQRQAQWCVQITGVDGSVDFETIVPGHYTGRAIHVHGEFILAPRVCNNFVKTNTVIVATHLGVKRNSNSTISGGTTAHVGQVYLDQELIDQVATMRLTLSTP